MFLKTVYQRLHRPSRPDIGWCQIPNRNLFSTVYSSLCDPTVLFSNNHLLVVNKPAGWHSVPNPQPSPKCLLSKLKGMELGGGSKSDFLIPLHRLDQPCSGVLLFAKTSKAASRVTTLWKRKMVQKDYLCVVRASRLSYLVDNSNIDVSGSTTRNGRWFTLKGNIDRRNSRKDGSVKILSSTFHGEAIRSISLEWRDVEMNSPDSSHALLHVRTNEGARHMVRALLAQRGLCPIRGDLRYGKTGPALPDQSVALHARRVSLDPSLRLGNLDVLVFQSPIPATWESYFGINGELLVGDCEV
jgi:23S rRNA pseudouridine1911/1915/1917 synthase